MARYYCNISGVHPFNDIEGTEHPNDHAAWRSAIRLIRDAEETLRPGEKWTLTVRTGERPVYLIEVTATTFGRVVSA